VRYTLFQSWFYHQSNNSVGGIESPPDFLKTTPAEKQTRERLLAGVVFKTGMFRLFYNKELPSSDELLPKL
jgi:hypothetical protein